ncbi:uncharacterized protein LTR77_004459 [Saxophila tyrrhenica]|uniref:Potassium transport protein n=1 Tax=Saxophila tyrrhenica TaxID=1690608 RepID=A0AAV9PDI2_9PEZI|nr:hypothetical protein LTR77_004459 [Saxophila tyrrhenica]
MARITLPNLGPLNKPLRFIRQQLPERNFITIHYSYFILTCLLSAVLFWGSSTPFRSVSFTDSLFLTVSAMTLAGLNTVNLSTLNTFQQFLLFVLIMLGSAIFVSAFVVHVRKRAFDEKFKIIKERERRSRRGRVKTWANGRLRGRSRETGQDEELAEDDYEQGKIVSSQSVEKRDETPPGRRGGPEMNGISGATGEPMPEDVSDDEGQPSKPSSERSGPGIKFRDDTRFVPTRTGTYLAPEPLRRRKTGLFSMQGVGARPMSTLGTNTLPDLQSFPTVQRQGPPPKPQSPRYDISRYFETATGWIARNSQFHGLSEEERDRLGGYAAHVNAVSPWWAGAFLAVSGFNNAGMSLLDANMVVFQRSYYMLLTIGLFILAGNTCYPLFLRLILWCMLKVTEWIANRTARSEVWQARATTLRFLLDHPRRCYTNLFPKQHTWWLALAVFMLNGVDWAMFEILNIGNSDLNDHLPTKYQVMDGLFQAIAVRSGGFYVVVIPSLRVSLQVLYVVMMYISVYPVVITMRNSNVYEERSLGIYAEEEEQKEEDEKADAKDQPKPGLLTRAKTFLPGGAATTAQESNSHFARQQLRAQLAHDTWYIVLALFLLVIIEADKFKKNPLVFSVFNFIFEVVSAYGCVGISVGVPWDAYSFCGSWSTLSKLILCAVMLRGRHRGLPVAIDKAVLLPGESYAVAEEEDGRIKLARSLTRARTENMMA